MYMKRILGSQILDCWTVVLETLIFIHHKRTALKDLSWTNVTKLLNIETVLALIGLWILACWVIFVVVPLSFRGVGFTVVLSEIYLLVIMLRIFKVSYHGLSTLDLIWNISIHGFMLAMAAFMCYIMALNTRTRRLYQTTTLYLLLAHIKRIVAARGLELTILIFWIMVKPITLMALFSIIDFSALSKGQKAMQVLFEFFICYSITINARVKITALYAEKEVRSGKGFLKYAIQSVLFAGTSNLITSVRTLFSTVLPIEYIRCL